MARIVVLLEGKQDRELLDEWLSQYHLLVDNSQSGPIDEAADLCILDGPSLIRFRDELQACRDREQPGFFPVLLHISRFPYLCISWQSKRQAVRALWLCSKPMNKASKAWERFG